MFAFAVWDASKRRLLLARDRLGIKPLYFAETPDYLIFASEIKAIARSGLIDVSIDLDSVDDLFSLSYPCPPRSMFRDIRELPPAHTLEAVAGRSESSVRRYWTLPIPPVGEHRKISRQDAEDEFRSLLRLRVYDHLISDVPTAAYLSGGLDSSAICSLMKDVTGDPPETFSISFKSIEHDEYEFAAEMAEYLGARNHALECDDALASDFERMIWHTELPLQFPLALPLMRLADTAKEFGFPVVLTGEGADELMGGYDCFRADKMRRILDRPGLRFLRPYVYKQLYKWHGVPDGTVDLMLNNQRCAPDIQRSFGGILPPWYDIWSTVGIERQELLGVGGRQVRSVNEAPDGFEALVPPNLDQLHPLDAAIALEQNTRLPAWILLIGDRAAMAAGVEARVPFLDHEIVEFVSSLPPSLKMNGFQEKAVLRRAMKDLLPPRIVERQKRPFYTPIREWFFSQNSPEFVQDMMSESALKDAGIFAPRVVSRFMRDVRLVPSHSLLRNQLEWTLILVLGTQILHRQFVAEKCERSYSGSQKI
jgi:asparagine synthase (glutamine-hydrolysing)